MDADFYRQQLFDDCLSFWFPRAVDEVDGGFLHCFGADGELVDDDKSVWAQGRMAWMLLTLSQEFQGNPDWLRWAESGLKFIREKCTDPEDGRLYFQVTREGEALRKRRYSYSESFAAIAFAAHAKVTGSDESAGLARTYFDEFIRRHLIEGIKPEKGTGARPAIDLGSRMIALVTAQELEKNLGKCGQWTQLIDRCLHEIETLFLKPDRQALMEQVAPDGSIINHFDGRTLNPGHSIECAWFIMEEAERRNDPRLVELGCQILEWMWHRGWDEVHGGLSYFVDVDGKPPAEYWHGMKFWWPHDEALIATAYAYRLTGNTIWHERHEQCREWSFGHFGDPENGEWFGYLNPDGSISSALKGSLWKSCFHHPRALLKCYQLLQK